MKKYFILILIIMSCSTSDDSATTPPTTTPQVTPETWGGWSPGFTTQISNFTQERTSNKGNRETRNISVTKQTSVVETNERYTQQDFNGDGDLIDYINLIEDTYTASNNLGSRVDSSSELSLNQDLNFLTRNFGLWAGGGSITEPFTQTVGSIYVDAGTVYEISPPPYLGWDVTDSSIDSYSSSNNGGCWNLVESDLTYDYIDINELTLTRYTSTIYGVPVGEVINELDANQLIENDIPKLDLMTTFHIVEELDTDGNLQSYNDITIGAFVSGSTTSIFFTVGYLQYYGFLDSASFTCPASSGKSTNKKMFDYIKLDSKFKNSK
jgi:hypothetical protein